MTTTFIQALEAAYTARDNCQRAGNKKWKDLWDERMEQLTELLPHGSGFDSGTHILTITPTFVVFKTAFHHMDDNGGYDRWTEHYVKAISLLSGFKVIVSGMNYREIKDYIGEVFYHLLSSEAPKEPWANE